MIHTKQLSNLCVVMLLSAFSVSSLKGQSQDVSLLTTSVLSKLPDGSYQAVVSIQNAGSAGASSVWLSAASLGNESGVPSAFPLPSIAPGTTVQATLNFAAAAGSSGTQTIERFAGTYSGGSFGASLRVVLPPLAVPAASVTAVVDPTQPAAPIPEHFMGFSMDSNVVDTYVGPTSVADPILINLINNFTPFNGIPTLRPAATPASSGSSNISAKFLTALTALENGTHAPLLVTIGLGRYDPVYAGNVAAAVTGALGTTNGVQFELGNEPDQLARQGYRPTPYTFGQYLAEYEGYAAAVGSFTAGKYAAGMAGGSTTWDSANAAPFLASESAHLGTFTSHEYPLTACEGTSSITIAHLLSDNISNAFYRRFQPLVAAATPYGVPVRAGEMNSVSCSGVVGVSDAFASTLWLLDSLFQLDLSGAAGMNLHTGSLSASQADLPYNAFYVNGTQVQVRPDYYGMLMFAEATQNHASLVPVNVQLTGTPNVKVWATIDGGRKLRIVVIEKDIDSASQTVSLSVGGSGTAAPGMLTRLETTSNLGVAATNQIFLHGQTFDGTTDGRLVGSPSYSAVMPAAGTYTVILNDGSAAMLEIQL